MSIITQKHLDSVTALGVAISDPNNAGNKSWIGTGFLVGWKRVEGDEIYLVTNKHVVIGKRELWVRFNSREGTTARDFPLLVQNQYNQPEFSAHPNRDVDIIAISLNRDFLVKTGSVISYFDLDNATYNIQQMKAKGIMEGSLVYALGYPMHMVGVKRQDPICRLGCVSRISDAFVSTYPVNFLVDAQTFPGNSGGPILSMADNDKIAMLIGILRAYIPYREPLVSQQTGQERSVMEENSGLTIVQPVDRILETVQLERRRIELMFAGKKSPSESHIPVPSV